MKIRFIFLTHLVNDGKYFEKIGFTFYKKKVRIF